MAKMQAGPDGYLYDEHGRRYQARHIATREPLFVSRAAEVTGGSERYELRPVDHDPFEVAPATTTHSGREIPAVRLTQEAKPPQSRDQINARFATRVQDVLDKARAVQLMQKATLPEKES